VHDTDTVTETPSESDADLHADLSTLTKTDADWWLVRHRPTLTVAVWPSYWLADFHADLLNNGVSPSQAAALTLTMDDAQ
jgi:hypothetical protein